MTIDTSAAAIERIKARRSGSVKCYVAVTDQMLADIDTLLAALAERDAKLAAHDACLTQVREEMPEVEAIRQLLVHEERTYGQCCGRQRQLMAAIDTLQQNEARWRNARDWWQAREADLRSMLAATEKANQAYHRQHQEMQQQLSASNAAADELRKDLEHSTKVLQQYVSLWDEAERQLTASNAACAEMREALETISRVAGWDSPAQRLATQVLAAQPKQQQGRTPEQYAIEHGRYLATAAGLFMEACNALVSAEQELDKAEPDTQEEVDDLMAKTESAQEIRGERFRALEKAIYEFTKRADRAYVMQQENGNG